MITRRLKSSFPVVSIAALLALAMPAGVHAATFTWEGTWEAGGVWGTMTLTGDVNSFEGNYTHDEGHMKASLTDAAARTYSGWWDEVPSRTPPNDAGDVTLTLTPDLRGFTGQWRYGSEGSWKSWSGTCTAGACLNNSAEDPEPADWELPDATVPLASVINGCGGGTAGTDPRWGDTSTYKNSAFGRPIVVNFRAACNMHDAGYSGAKVVDPLRSNQVTDFFGWTQKRVDDRFLFDMRALCTKQIPARFAEARKDCFNYGGYLSIGAKSRYDVVRAFGHRWYVKRPRIAGSWSAGGVKWSFNQTGRKVTGTWQKGNRSGKLAGIVISRDQDAIVRGFEKVKTGGTWEIGALTMRIPPKTPNRIVGVSSVSFDGALTRLSVR